MPVLTVGKTEIPYRIRFSSRAKRKSIRLTPEDVEVVLPEGIHEQEGHQFIQQKRQWVYRKLDEIELKRRQSSHLRWPDRFVSGVKIPFRGRMMKLKVVPSDEEKIRIEYRGGFIVHKSSSATEEDVEKALIIWLTGKVTDDAIDFAGEYAPKLGVKPRLIQVKAMKTLWGSCSPKGNISINWKLVFQPKAALEYVVVHELCHLKHRGHTNTFWNTIAGVLPNYYAQRQSIREGVIS